MKKDRKASPPPDLDALSDDEILAMRIRDLQLSLDRAPMLRSCVDELYANLAAQGLVFRPPCYLADEWLCPNKEPIVGIPFYLAHPRLVEIERRLMFEVEGGTSKTCLQLLRHECGHTINYAYRLYRRSRWRELFGPFSAPYSSSYAFQPYSRRYVIHLPDSYAQCHPDEDFAETFAVWLDPHSDWREKYAGWPAMKKLLYVDRLMRQIGQVPGRVKAQQAPWSAQRMTSTLQAFYDRRRRYLGKEYPGYYDGVLRQIFVEKRGGTRAARFLRQHRRPIMDSVAQWTGERKYDVHELLKKLIRRCEELTLCVEGAERDTLVRVSTLICAIIANRLRLEDEGAGS